MHYIEFPNLGIHIDLDPVIFSIGIFQVHWYGIITALAFLIVVAGVIKNAPKYDLNQDHMIDLILITVPIGVLGARLFYVIVNWKYYSANLSEIYKIWHGGLAIYGGIILGLITIYLFCRRKKINTLHLLDHIVVYLVLGQVVGRWGNFVNQELFGPNTDLPWGMTGDIIKHTIAVEGFKGVDPNLPVHPLFLYESLWNLAALFILLWFRKRKKQNGEVFFLYMIAYGGARFVIDSMRFDLKVGDVNINRLLGIVFVIAFTVVFIIRRIRLKKEPLDDADYKPSRYREIIDEMGDEPEDSKQEDSESAQNGPDESTDDFQTSVSADGEDMPEVTEEPDDKEKVSEETDERESKEEKSGITGEMEYKEEKSKIAGEMEYKEAEPEATGELEEEKEKPGADE